MTRILHPQSELCSKDEIDLFSIPQTQTDIIESTYASFNPISSLQGDLSPIEFILPPSGDLFLDPSNIYLHLKVKLQNTDGSELGDENKFFPENLLLHSLFSSLDIYLNETNITSSSYNYTYRAYLETILNFSADEKNTFLRAGGYYPSLNSIKESYMRSKRTSIDLYGKLHADICAQPKLLLNGVNVKIKLSRSPHQFALNYPPNIELGSKLASVTVTDAYLYARRVRLSSSVQLHIEKSLHTSTAKYPLTRVEVKQFTITSGLLSKSLDNLSLGNLPSRFIIGLVKHKACNGDYRHSGFKFEHFNLKRVACYVNGSLIARPYDMKYTRNGGYDSQASRAYYSLYESVGSVLGITLEEYIENKNLYAFNLALDQSSSCISECINPIQQGSLSVVFEFDSPLIEPISAIIYSEFCSLVEIDLSRNVLTNF